MTEPRWLTPAEQRAWRAYLYSAKRLFEALDQQMQRDADMPHAYWQILVRLSEAPGRSLRMSELAESTWSSRSRTSHAVARLEERGWVARGECATDRRGQIAVLTDAGFAVVESSAPGHVGAAREFVIDALTPEQLDQLAVIGEAIVARIEERATASPPAAHATSSG